jgi:hypothetical protein
MDDTNLEWLDQKSPINHPFKGFNPTDLLLPQLTHLNPIFGPELPKLKKIPKKKVSIPKCSLIMLIDLQT